MILKGDIDDIRFRNEENGYTILTLDHKGDPVVCVGVFPPLTEGESVELSGSFVMHAKFGRQFKVESVKTQEPESLDGIVRFLGSGAIKGLGPKTALAITSVFKDNTLKILEFEPHKLSTVRGISKPKAIAIGEAFAEIKTTREAIMFLQGLGLGLNLALKIFKVYGADTIAVVKTNPYLLVEDVERIGFLTADKIGAAGGIKPDSAFRIRAGILYVLKEAAEKNGNTYLPKAELLKLSCKLLNLEEELVLGGIENLLYDQKVKQVSQNEDDGIMFSQYYRIEKVAAQKLCEMLASSNSVVLDAESIVAEYERNERIALHASQIDAVLGATSSGVSVITGGPGTGKTTIIKCILRIFQAFGKTVQLLAPTGRAAKRLSEQTGDSASTIHRALLSGGGEPFVSNIVIIDEVSMVDVFLLNQLLSKLKPETQLILVGDKDQLPSVGAGNVLADILSSGVFNVHHLARVFRQDDESLIVANAHKINEGAMPNLASKDRDFFFVEASLPEDVAKKTIQLVSERLPKYLNCSPKKIQILCPMKNGEAGTLRLNECLADIINDSNDKRELVSEGQRFRVGDKVMHIANNYELTWKRFNGKFTENGEGVFNGDAGVVYNVNTQSGELVVHFEDGREAIYTADIRNQLVLSYAITIHKSQGSEFDACVIPMVAGNYMIMTRNLLYTAITRAKKMVVLVGDRSVIKRVIDNNFIQKRYSYLKPFILEMQKKNALLYGDAPK